MPSPFPGMDPYLEDPARWTDVHQSLITYIRDEIQPHILPHYHARMGERIYVVYPRKDMYPNVALVKHQVREPSAVYAPPAPPTMLETPTSLVSPTTDEAPTALVSPTILTFDAEYREPFVEIVHTADDEVVTVIEVLSPANKTAGEGHARYTKKQNEILNSAAHLVEIDLLARGLHTVAFPEGLLAELPPHRYRISVRRAPHYPQAEAYPIPLEGKLPHFGIPLRDPDPDVGLDLQAVFTKSYDNGGYETLIDYQRPPKTQLSREETAWVDGLLTGKRVRKQ